MISKIIQKGSTAKMAAFMSFSSLLSYALTIISGLFIAKWLLPEKLGLFSSFNIITSYIILVQLGVPSGLIRQFPFYMGGKNETKALKIVSVSQYYSLFTAFIAFGLALITALIFLINKNYLYAAGIFVIGVTSFQGLYTTKYLKLLYRNNSDFNKLSVIEIVNSISQFGSIYFIYKYGFWGLCIRTVLSALIDLSITFYLRPLKIKPAWDKNIFVEIIKVGMPMYWVANIYGLWPVVQRTVILSIGGTKALGLFSLCGLVEAGMGTLSNSIFNISFPKLAFAWGQGINFNSLFKMLLKPVGVTFFINGFVACAGWFILPFFITNFLPNYQDGLRAAQMMLLTGWVGSFLTFSSLYMIIQKNLDRMWSFLSGVVAWLIFSYTLTYIYGFNLVIFPLSVMAGYIIIYIVDTFNFLRYSKLNLCNLNKH